MFTYNKKIIKQSIILTLVHGSVKGIQTGLFLVKEKGYFSAMNIY
jgi:hypothetical protein